MCVLYNAAAAADDDGDDDDGKSLELSFQNRLDIPWHGAGLTSLGKVLHNCGATIGKALLWGGTPKEEGIKSMATAQDDHKAQVGSHR